MSLPTLCGAYNDLLATKLKDIPSYAKNTFTAKKASAASTEFR